MPILVGTDGIQKMSKSLGNYIGVSEEPKNIYGKIMSIPDSVMMDYYQLLTRLPENKINKIREDLDANIVNPAIIKRNLAHTLVANLYGKDEADKAEDNFNKIFKERSLPDEIEISEISRNNIGSKTIKLTHLLTMSGLCSSNSDSRRMIEQGGIKIDNIKITDVNKEIPLDDIDSKVIQKGKRAFVKIKVVD
jgi:tyrosyl-tRNA synthetase